MNDPSRPDLRIGRLTRVWLPLAATFLLVTGATPVVNAAINRLPDRVQETDLAAFAVFMTLIIVMHGPLFVAREIAIKLSRHRGGDRQAMRFLLIVAGFVSAGEALMGFTPLGRLVAGQFATEPAVVEGAHDAFRFIWPVPFVIVIRGIAQAHQIRADDTLFVGLGTLVRLGVTAFIGFKLGPMWGVPGPTLGAICITIGIIIEAGITVLRTRAIEREGIEFEEPGPTAWEFGLPLMLANSLGLFTSVFFLRIAGLVPEDMQEYSLAAFQEVKPIHWFLSAGAFALQSLTTAKVRRESDVAPMIRFSLVVGGGLTACMCLIAFTPLRMWILRDLMGEHPDGQVVKFAIPALMVAAPLPLLTAFRFVLRGIIISRGRSRPITVCNVVSLLILASAASFSWRVSGVNGALNAYVFWLVTIAIELALLARAAFGPGARDDGALPPPVRSPREAAAG